MLRQDVLIAFGAIGGIELLATVMPLPISLHLIALSTLIVYVGCYFSTLPNSEKTENTEVLEKQDALMFPFIGSAVLFSLYIVFKIFPAFMITFFVKMYFGVIGAYVIASRVQQIAGNAIAPEMKRKLETKVTIPLSAVNAKLTPLVKDIKIKAKPVEPYLEKAKAFYEQVKPKVLDVITKIEQLIAKIPEMIPALQQYFPSEPKSNLSDKLDISKVKTPSVSDAISSVKSTVQGSSEDLLPHEIVLSQFEAVSYGIGAAVSFLYVVTNWWLLSNLIAICFAIQALEFVNIGSFFNGAILLCGLFFYDIFWVFGTDVMVTVAKKFDGPIKLIFPRAAGLHPAMLGLGDIVVPGFYIALMLRFDRKLNKPKTSITFENLKNTPLNLQAVDKYLDFFGNLTKTTFKTEFFNTAIFSYVFGLLVTIFVMFVFGAAQPALLYLVPAVLGGTVGLAYYRGKPTFDTLINYESDEEKSIGDKIDKVADKVSAKATESLADVKGFLGGISKKAENVLDEAAESLKQAEQAAEQAAAEASAAAEEAAAVAVEEAKIAAEKAAEEAAAVAAEEAEKAAEQATREAQEAAEAKAAEEEAKAEAEAEKAAEEAITETANAATAEEIATADE